MTFRPIRRAILIYTAEKKSINTFFAIDKDCLFHSTLFPKFKMGFFDHFSNSHQQLQDTPEEHKGSLTHEVIAAAASYEAVKAYNEHCEKNGKPNDHAKAVQILAGFAGGALDKLIETKGLDYLDKQKAKRHAEEQVKQYYETEHTY